MSRKGILKVKSTKGQSSCLDTWILGNSSLANVSGVCNRLISLLIKIKSSEVIQVINKLSPAISIIKNTGNSRKVRQKKKCTEKEGIVCLKLSWLFSKNINSYFLKEQTCPSHIPNFYNFFLYNIDTGYKFLVVSKEIEPIQVIVLELHLSIFTLEFLHIKKKNGERKS